jgi:hypothetical protein
MKRLKSSASPKRRLRQILPGVALSVLVAFGLTLLIHNLLTAPQYHIDAEELLLTSADVGPLFTQAGEGSVGPTQSTVSPLPYQQQMIAGRLREFMANSVLSPQGRQQIGDWESKYGFQPTSPPTIMGPFVAEHNGIFDVISVVRSFQTVDAAGQEYHCCHYVDRDLNFDDYHTVPVHLGDESDGWTGISKSLTIVGSNAPKMPTDPAYQERGYDIHWRHGPIVTTVAVWGAHDVTLAEAMHIAEKVDAHITQALQTSAKESSHAEDPVAGSPAGDSSLCVADHRAYRGLHRD